MVPNSNLLFCKPEIGLCGAVHPPIGTPDRDVLRLVIAGKTGQTEIMRSLGKTALLAAALVTLLLGVLSTAPSGAQDMHRTAAHSAPCPHPVSSHDGLTGHGDAGLCQLCLSCSVFRHAQQTADLQAGFARLDVPIPNALPVHDHVTGFDPPPPRL